MKKGAFVLILFKARDRLQTSTKHYNTIFSLLVIVETTAAPAPAVYCRSIAFLLVVWLFEIYRFIRKIFTDVPYNT